MISGVVSLAARRKRDSAFSERYSCAREKRACETHLAQTHESQRYFTQESPIETDTFVQISNARRRSHRVRALSSRGSRPIRTIEGVLTSRGTRASAFEHIVGPHTTASHPPSRRKKPDGIQKKQRRRRRAVRRTRPSSPRHTSRTARPRCSSSACRRSCRRAPAK